LPPSFNPLLLKEIALESPEHRLREASILLHNKPGFFCGASLGFSHGIDPVTSLE
jgi:hypothetical protein